jgi:proteic killer suppression protein
VYIEFASKRLADASLRLAAAIRIFGLPIGRKYMQRLAVLRAVEKFGQLYGLKALRLHPLKGKYEGLYSISLSGNFRLILEKIKEGRIKIIGLEDYHGN